MITQDDIDAFTTPDFNWQKPTVQMLGRWQPWHAGHTKLFKKAHAITGQVVIQVRDVMGIVGEDAGGGRTAAQTDNPFYKQEVFNNIEKGLYPHFTRGKEYVIMVVPNIVDISYGRGVGYTFTEHDLGKDVHDISATKIRAKMRAEGVLKYLGILEKNKEDTRMYSNYYMKDPND